MNTQVKKTIKESASLGGQAVPAHERAFSKDAALARRAGRLGGQAVPAAKRTFSRDPELARKAGRKGALARIAKEKNRE